MENPNNIIEKILCVSISHKKAPVEVIETVYWMDGPEDIIKLKSESLSEELVLIQTCNRVEIYAYSEKPETSERIIRNLFEEKIREKFGDIKKKDFIESFFGIDAVKHLFRVVSSLESMMIGEYEVLGQVKRGYLKAVKAGAVNEHLKLVFEKAIAVGKRVRTETEISKKPVSLAHASVSLAEDMLGNLSGLNILLIGAGRVAGLVASSLEDHNVKRVTVLNRTFEKAVKLAEKFDFKSAPLSEWKKYVGDADLVFVATSADHYIINASDLEKILLKEDNGKVIIDLSNPRNVEDEVRNFSGVKLRTLDDLKKITEENRKTRLREIKKVEQIVCEEITLFEEEVKKLVARMILKKLFKEFDEIRMKELEKAVKILDVDGSQMRVLDTMTKSIVNKILTPVVTKAYEAASKNEFETIYSLAKIFSGGD